MFGRLHTDEQKKVVIEWLRKVPSVDDRKQNKRLAIPFLLNDDVNIDDYAVLRSSSICILYPNRIVHNMIALRHAAVGNQHRNRHPATSFRQIVPGRLLLQLVPLLLSDVRSVLREHFGVDRPTSSCCLVFYLSNHGTEECSA
jgi:hypothetical protein